MLFGGKIRRFRKYWVLTDTSPLVYYIKDIKNSSIQYESIISCSNVTRQDNSNGFLYTCSAESYFRNEFKLGNHVHLQVIQSGSSAGLQNKHEPERQYTSRRNEVAFR